MNCPTCRHAIPDDNRATGIYYCGRDNDRIVDAECSCEHYEPLRHVVHTGDAREVLKTLPSAAVHTVVTSPPYWWLRDYQIDGQLGMEPSPDDLVRAIVVIFREVWRVLHPTGTVWLNIADTFTSGHRKTRAPDAMRGRGVKPGQKRPATPAGLKPKELAGVPQRLFLALQADGWYMRQVNVWAKPNPATQSTKDRPIPNFEYVYLLTKQERYYYDHVAVLQPFADDRNGADGGTRGRERNVGGRTDGYTRASGIDPSPNGGRLLRTVWEIPVEPYKGNHTATFPHKLAAIAVAAGTSEAGCCPKCGAPYERIITKDTRRDVMRKPANWDTREGIAHGTDFPGRRSLLDSMGANKHGGYDGKPTKNYPAWGAQSPNEIKRNILSNLGYTRTVGFRARCKHNDTPILRPRPCTVLDPFCGSGRAGVVAKMFGRDFIGIDLSPDYAEQARRNIEAGPLPQEPITYPLEERVEMDNYETFLNDVLGHVAEYHPELLRHYAQGVRP